MRFKSRAQQAAVMASLKVRRNNQGYITEVVNPHSKTHKTAVISSTGRPGFTVSQDKPYKQIKWGFRKEHAAINYAVGKGYHKVLIRD